MAEQQQPPPQPQQSPYDGRYGVNEGQGQGQGEAPPPARQPPFKMPKHPWWECCGSHGSVSSIKTGLLIWVIFFWIYGVYLFILACLVILSASNILYFFPHPNWITFCTEGLGGVISAVITTLVYFVALIVLTVARFGSVLSPQLRIRLTKAFYFVLFPVFLVLALVVLIVNMLEGYCYDFSEHDGIILVVVTTVIRLALSVFFVFKGRDIGRANIYCIQVEDFYKNNAIYEEGQQGQNQSQAEDNRQLNA